MVGSSSRMPSSMACATRTRIIDSALRAAPGVAARPSIINLTCARLSPGHGESVVFGAESINQVSSRLLRCRCQLSEGGRAQIGSGKSADGAMLADDLLLGRLALDGGAIVVSELRRTIIALDGDRGAVRRPQPPALNSLPVHVCIQIRIGLSDLHRLTPCPNRRLAALRYR